MYYDDDNAILSDIIQNCIKNNDIDEFRRRINRAETTRGVSPLFRDERIFNLIVEYERTEFLREMFYNGFAISRSSPMYTYYCLERCCELNAVIIAAKKGSLSILKLTLESVKCTESFNYFLYDARCPSCGATVLLAAVMSGDFECFKYIRDLRRTCRSNSGNDDNDVENCDDWDTTRGTMSVAIRRTSITKEKTFAAENALMLAVKVDSPRIARELLEGEDDDVKALTTSINVERNSVLHFVSSAEMAMLLVMNGAEQLDANAYGVTPLVEQTRRRSPGKDLNNDVVFALQVASRGRDSREVMIVMALLNLYNGDARFIRKMFPDTYDIFSLISSEERGSSRSEGDSWQLRKCRPLKRMESACEDAGFREPRTLRDADDMDILDIEMGSVVLAERYVGFFSDECALMSFAAFERLTSNGRSRDAMCIVRALFRELLHRCETTVALSPRRRRKGIVDDVNREMETEDDARRWLGVLRLRRFYRYCCVGFRGSLRDVRGAFNGVPDATLEQLTIDIISCASRLVDAYEAGTEKCAVVEDCLFTLHFVTCSVSETTDPPFQLYARTPVREALRGLCRNCEQHEILALHVFLKYANRFYLRRFERKVRDLSIARIAKILLEFSANKQPVDSEGRTALHIALDSPKYSRYTVKAIFEVTSDIDIYDDSGRCALKTLRKLQYIRKRHIFERLKLSCLAARVCSTLPDNILRENLPKRLKNFVYRHDASAAIKARTRNTFAGPN